METTSKKVAAIAGRVLKTLDREMFTDHGRIQPKADAKVPDTLGYFVLAQVCTVADLKALAGSCLTQHEKPKDTTESRLLKMLKSAEKRKPRILICGNCRQRYDANKPHKCKTRKRK